MTLAQEMEKVRASELVDLPAWLLGNRRALFLGSAGRMAQSLPSAFTRAKPD